jgi:hypothetical protein
VGLNVPHLDSGIHLKQHLLSTQVANTYHCCAIHQNTPLPESSLVTSTSAPVDKNSFCSVLGSLMYLA